MKNKLKDINFLKLSVCASYLTLIAYTVIVLVMSYKGVIVPDILTQYFFIVFGVEFASQAAIQITKYRIKKVEQSEKVESLKENSIPVERQDFNNNSDSYESVYYEGGPYG